jgi:hypothetical protein
MEIELTTRKAQFILGESLRVEVTVHNRSDVAVAVPAIADTRNTSLSYRLTGPSVPADFVFQYARPGGRRLTGEPEMVSLEPGGQVTVPITIEGRTREWQPGAHVLRATLDVGGSTVESNTLSFEILEPTVLAGRVVAEALSSPGGVLRVEVLAAAGGTTRVYQGFFTEARPGLETEPALSLTEALEVPPGASDLGALWTDFQRSGSMISPRYVWLDGRTVAVQEFQSPPITFEVGTERLLRPGILTREGDALLVSWEGRNATLTRVPRNGAASRVWEATLPLPAADGRVWITPDGKVTAVFTAEGTAGVSLAVVREGAVIGTTVIEDAVLLPSSEPGITISGDGAIWVSVLVAEPARRRTVSIVDWDWKPGEVGTAATRRPAATLAQDAKAAAVVYTLSGSAPRRDWVILQGTDIILTSRSPGRPRMLNATPFLPLQVLPRPEMSFLLLRHPKQIATLTPLY